MQVNLAAGRIGDDEPHRPPVQRLRESRLGQRRDHRRLLLHPVHEIEIPMRPSLPA
jgi:hypothetical protein